MSGTAEKPSYRAEVIGSLLRPPEVKQAMQDAATGKIGRDELARVQDRAILDAIKLQEDCGLDVITDGEYRRAIFWDPVIAALDGLDTQAISPVMFGGSGATGDVQLPAVTGKIALRESVLQPEMRFLLAHTDRPVKATMPAMAQASALWLPDVSRGAYPTREEYVADLVQIMRGEIAALVDMGVGYIQIDSPRYTYACSEAGRDRLRALGIEPESWFGEMIAFDNQLIAGFPGVTFGLHLCRGNHRSGWAVEGGYDPIAERLFNELNVDRLLLEYDTPRAGTFAPLRFVPKDKVAVLGLVSTKEARVETGDEIRRRVDEAAEYLPLEQLALSPQCGFASTMPGNLLGEEAQRRKLELVASVAREVWGDA
ncbi:MAG TPA: cobalamin-independent methionine synthase II family protein [Thermomicrobiales bacterium]|nr:cobalamin-independent methionine synthase II family protein [Thermomicrobiales bacterium]